MKQKKLSLANIHGKLSRAEMKKIMAGSDSGGCATSLSWCDPYVDCTFSSGGTGKCRANTGGTTCYCAGAS
ncbi:hypothetical protein A3860_05510 [Niastella vici]|uniref:Uncharacterized protein n=1 Tax=Niastella vici TaxID=1703345 RepID=A0A1V9FS42_9BACT|nr:hypothetical protein A3860_05510 [Niastella vici]